MEKILFVTDGASDLTPEYVADNPIAMVTATICFGGKEYREYYDLKPQVFWDLLEELDEIPVTQQATPMAFLDCYKKAVEQGYTHIIVSVISSTASGAMNSAMLAKELLREELGADQVPVIEILDSLGYSMMYGHIVLEGVRQAAGGRPFSEIVAYMQDSISRYEALFMVYSLKHIRKSGRIGGMSAFVGEALGLRPILRAVDGKIEPIEKVRGEKNVISRMLELVKMYCVEPENQTFHIVYAKLPDEEINRAEDELTRTFSPRSIIRTPIGCSVASNTGPYCMGIIYCGAKRV